MKAVIFDLGNVLVFFDARRAAKRLAKACKIPVWKIWLHFFTSPEERAYTCGKISSRDFFRQFKKALGYPGDFESFRKTWNHIFWKNTEMEKILWKLRQNYRLYLISNTNKMHFDYIQKKYRSLLKPFHELFPSHEMGCRKPDIEIYKKVLKRIKLKAPDTVFIDDMSDFVRGARKAGMHAIRYRNMKQLCLDLRKLGVEI